MHTYFVSRFHPTAPTATIGQTAANNNSRDAAMAANLEWMADRRFAHDKIIVWGASFHLMRDIDSIRALPAPNKAQLDYNGLIPTGVPLARKYGKQFVSIAFVAHDGTIANLDTDSTSSLPAPRPESMESWCVQADLNNAIIDLRLADSPWDGQPFTASPLGYRAMEAVWPRVFDAFVFNRHMEPNILLPDPTTIASPADAGTDAPH